MDSKTTTAQMQTPFRFGRFNWSNSLSYLDNSTKGIDSTFVVEPDTTTPNPTDSIRTVTYYAGSFRSEFDWNTGINLPFLLSGTWKIQPTIGVQNVTSGPFALRNRRTNGDWVVQGKRANFSLSMAPTFFAFFNVGFIPGLSRMRHSISPLLTWSFAPAATVPQAYAEAIAVPGQEAVLRSQPQNLLTLALNQNFEVKERPKPEDSLGTQARKYRLLSIQTSPWSYDFNQAGEPGKTGWKNQELTNSFLSDLVPGFQMALGLDMWRGRFDSDTAVIAPFMNSLTANFQLTSATFKSLFGGAGAGAGRGGYAPGQSQSIINDPNRRNGGIDPTIRTLLPSMQGSTGSFGQQGFTSTFAFTLQRFRPSDYPAPLVKPEDQVSLNYTLGFNPTQFWAVSWQAQYNFTQSKFESQTVSLQRELHEWRAAFRFTRNANGNFAFFFSVWLTDLPDLKYDYQQTTFEQ